jgi:hypothetical protein
MMPSYVEVRFWFSVLVRVSSVLSPFHPTIIVVVLQAHALDEAKGLLLMGAFLTREYKTGSTAEGRPQVEYPVPTLTVNPQSHSGHTSSPFHWLASSVYKDWG